MKSPAELARENLGQSDPLKFLLDRKTPLALTKLQQSSFKSLRLQEARAKAEKERGKRELQRRQRPAHERNPGAKLHEVGAGRWCNVLRGSNLHRSGTTPYRTARQP